MLATGYLTPIQKTAAAAVAAIKKFYLERNHQNTCEKDSDTRKDGRHPSSVTARMAEDEYDNTIPALL